MKQCRMCDATKKIEHFYKSKTTKDGRYRICKDCLRDEQSTTIKCDSCATEKKSPEYYRHTTSPKRMTTCKDCYGPRPRRIGPGNSYWVGDPVDTTRMIEVLGNSIAGLKKQQQIDLWNKKTDLVLPRMSMRGKELTALG